MVSSRSDLSREEIRKALVGLVGEDRVQTDDVRLRVVSVDRFKKYTAVNGIYDGPIPAAVVSRATAEVVRRILRFANEHTVNVVPRTGSTSTEGGLETTVDDTIVIDGSLMNEIVGIDAVNMMATAQCGVVLEALEDAVRARASRRGTHLSRSPSPRWAASLRPVRPVSSRPSTAASRTWSWGSRRCYRTAPFVGPRTSRRAAGPDIRHIVIGSEGALCFITEVTVQARPVPHPRTTYIGATSIDDMDTGIAAVREVVTGGFRPSVCRVDSEEDAHQHFADFHKGKCVLIFICEGPQAIVAATVAEIDRVMEGYPHEDVDPGRIAQWFRNLNWGMDKILAERETMRSEHRLGFTTEISANWSDIGEIYRATMHRIRTEFPYAADITMLGAHSSHSYQTGTNLYFVYDYNINCEPRNEITKYHIPLNAIIVEEALSHGGSMVHHHGIGKYRTAYRAEHGERLSPAAWRGKVRPEWHHE